VGGPEVENLRSCVNALDSDLKQVVLHLGEVTFIDSSGLGTMVRLLAKLRARDGDMHLCDVPEVVSKILKLTNLHTLLEMHSTETEAISAFYRKGQPSGIPRSEIRVLCVDPSPDILAYLREVLRRAGYQALAANNVYDALILLRAAPPKLLVLGPTMQMQRAGYTAETFRNVAAGVPVVELGVDFSMQDAGVAATQLIERVRAVA
jgi:anti-sigma B factor antagonist